MEEWRTFTFRREIVTKHNGCDLHSGQGMLASFLDGNT